MGVGDKPGTVGSRRNDPAIFQTQQHSLERNKNKADQTNFENRTHSRGKTLFDLQGVPNIEPVNKTL